MPRFLIEEETIVIVGGGAAGPNAKWPENLKIRDAVIGTLALTDKVKATDKLSSATLGLSDKVKATDKLSVVGSGAFPDKVNALDVLSRVDVSNVTVTRSGTPDTNDMGDCWVDKANTAVNHGNETPLKLNSEVVNTEKRAYIEFDLTKYTSLTAFAGGLHTTAFVTLLIGNDAAVATNTPTYSFISYATRPLTESTFTWATNTGNEPAGGTVVVPATSIPFPGTNLPAGVTTSVAWGITDANLNALLGKWVLLKLTSTVVVTNFTIASREDATPANRPKFGFSLKR